MLALSEGVREIGDVPPYDGWQALSGVLDWLVKAWDRPGEGIWERAGARGAMPSYSMTRTRPWTRPC